VRGEHIAWMKSSAVIYANSVLGARTNCEGTASAGAASLTGKIPCWGNHREENRYGTHLIDVHTPVDSFLDWGMLGYFAGAVAGEEHPVITGDLGRPDLADLKHFGAAAATSGGVELYHIPGITPEAPTLEAAFGGASPPEPVHYGPAERRAVYETLNSQGDQAAPSDFITSAGHRGGYILSARDLITNDIEVAVEGALLDGMLCLASCDKTAPGQLMAAARLNIPSVIVACEALGMALPGTTPVRANSEPTWRGALRAPARSEERGWLSIYQRLVRPLPEGAVLREPAP